MNEHNKECDQSKCGQFPNCNNYACNGEHDCTCATHLQYLHDPKICLFPCTCPVTTQEPTNGEEKQDWEADIYCCEGDRDCTEGRHDFIRTLIASAKEEERREVIEQVKEWKRNYMYETTKHYGTDKHGIDPDDLGEFLESLKTNSK